MPTGLEISEIQPGAVFCGSSEDGVEAAGDAQPLEPEQFARALRNKFVCRAAYIYQSCDGGMDDGGVDLETMAWLLFIQDLTEFIETANPLPHLKEEFYQFLPDFMALPPEMKMRELALLWKPTGALDLNKSLRYKPTPFEETLSGWQDTPRYKNIMQSVIDADPRLKKIHENFNAAIQAFETRHRPPITAPLPVPIRQKVVPPPAAETQDHRSIEQDQTINTEDIGETMPKEKTETAATKIFKTKAFENWWKGLFIARGETSYKSSLLYLQGYEIREIARVMEITNPTLVLRNAFTGGKRSELGLVVGVSTSDFKPDREKLAADVLKAYEESQSAPKNESEASHAEEPPAEAKPRRSSRRHAAEADPQPQPQPANPQAGTALSQIAAFFALVSGATTAQSLELTMRFKDNAGKPVGSAVEVKVSVIPPDFPRQPV